MLSSPTSSSPSCKGATIAQLWCTAMMYSRAITEMTVHHLERIWTGFLPILASLVQTIVKRFLSAPQFPIKGTFSFLDLLILRFHSILLFYWAIFLTNCNPSYYFRVHKKALRERLTLKHSELGRLTFLGLIQYKGLQGTAAQMCLTHPHVIFAVRRRNHCNAVDIHVCL